MGECIAEWATCKVGDVASCTAGGTPSTQVYEYWSPEEVLWMSSGEVHKKRITHTDKKISRIGLENSSAKIIPSESVVIALAGQGKTRGTVAITKTELSTNQSIAAIRPCSAFFPEFLFYNLHSRYDELRQMSSGEGGRGGLNLSIINSIEVPTPPLPEQKKIARILSTVDRKLELIEQQITTTRTLKKGLMQKLFSEGVGTQDASGCWQPHTEFKDSELGKIPVGWELKNLSEVCKKIGDGIHATPKYVENSEYYFVNGNNLKNGKLVITESTKCVSEEELKKHQINLCDGTVLMSINGTIGNLAFYNGEKVVLGKSAAYLSVSDQIDNSYLFYLLSAPFIQKGFELELTGTTIKNLSLKSIRNTAIPVPTPKEQKEIANILSTVDKKLDHLTTRKDQTEQLKKGLMQQLLTGKIRVTPDPQDRDAEGVGE